MYIINPKVKLELFKAQLSDSNYVAPPCVQCGLEGKNLQESDSDRNPRIFPWFPSQWVWELRCCVSSCFNQHVLQVWETMRVSSGCWWFILRAPIYSGWWFQPLWKIWKSVGNIVPNIWKNKKYSQPPTRIGWKLKGTMWLCDVTNITNRQPCEITSFSVRETSNWWHGLWINGSPLWNAMPGNGQSCFISLYHLFRSKCVFAAIILHQKKDG